MKIGFKSVWGILSASTALLAYSPEAFEFNRSSDWSSEAPFTIVQHMENNVLQFSYPDEYSTGARFTSTETFTDLLSDPTLPAEISIDIKRINDTYLGAPQYFGNIQFYVSVPDKGIANEYIGQMELDDLKVGAFKTYRFPVASEYRNLLSDSSGVRIHFRLSINSGNTHDDFLLVDNIKITSGIPTDSTVTDISDLSFWSPMHYQAGDRVLYKKDNSTIIEVYEAKPWPYTPWCQQAVYAPGSTLWEHAWIKVGYYSQASSKGTFPRFDQWWDLGEFKMTQGEITQGEFYDLLGTNPSEYTPDGHVTYGSWRNHPVENVSWYDAIFYANALSKKEGRDTVYTYTSRSGTIGENLLLSEVKINKAALGYRLPTHSHWKKAALPWKSQYRSGSYEDHTYPWKDIPENFSRHAWYKAEHHSPIMTKEPVPNGLSDVGGNVSELLDKEEETSITVQHCGGSFNTTSGWEMRVNNAQAIEADSRSGDRGFRLMLVQDPWESLATIWSDNPGTGNNWHQVKSWATGNGDIPEFGISYDSEIDSEIVTIKSASSEDKDRVRCWWQHDLDNLEPNRSYVITALVKADNVIANECIIYNKSQSEYKGAIIGANNKISREGLSSVGSFGWKKVSAIFQTDEEGKAMLQLSLGARGSTATGEVSFANVEVKGPLKRVVYEDRYFADLEPRQTRRISETNVLRWLGQIKKIHDEMETITGREFEDKTSLLGVYPSSEFTGGLSAYMGSAAPFNYGTDGYLWILENTVEPHNNITFGALHEIGHTHTRKGFNFANELMANFLAFLALERMPDAVVYNGQFKLYTASMESTSHTVTPHIDDSTIQYGLGPDITLYDSIYPVERNAQNWKLAATRGKSQEHLDTISHHSGVLRGLIKMYRAPGIGKEAIYETLQEMAIDSPGYINVFEEFFSTLRLHTQNKVWRLDEYFSSDEINWMHRMDQKSNKAH